MKIKVITVATSEKPELTALKQSAQRHGMDLTVLGMNEPWRGFGTKIILTCEYLRTLEDYSHFIFVDAYDTLFLKPITSYKGGIVFSTEKQPWPDADAPYSTGEMPWRYLNSGCYIAPVKEFVELVDKHPFNYEDDDQRYFTSLYLKGLVQLDVGCELFQSYAFQSPGDFSLKNGLLINNIKKTEPAIVHFNGKCLDKKIYNMVKYQSLKDVQQIWIDRPEVHDEINKSFVALVNDTQELKSHRDFVEQNIFGFGERSFHWLWNLIIKEMPTHFTFLEIGVFKGQTLSLCELLARMHTKEAKRYGITPLSTEGGVWESDYDRDIQYIHDQFGLNKNYTIIKGLSEDPKIIKQARKLKLDILYIDGGHEERHIINDIDNYAHLVKPGGFMVIDDSCNSFRMPFGYFQGIEAVTKVVDAKLPPVTPSQEWEFLFNVVHNRVYRRIK